MPERPDERQLDGYAVGIMNPTEQRGRQNPEFMVGNAMHALGRLPHAVAVFIAEEREEMRHNITQGALWDQNEIRIAAIDPEFFELCDRIKTDAYSKSKATTALCLIAVAASAAVSQSHPETVPAVQASLLVLGVSAYETLGRFTQRSAFLRKVHEKQQQFIIDNAVPAADEYEKPKKASKKHH